MAKGEKNYNPAESSRKADKKKEKEKNKQNLKANQATNALNRELKAREQEFMRIAVRQTSSEQQQGHQSSQLNAKLGEINTAREKLQLLPKTMSDYDKIIKEAKKSKNLESKRKLDELGTGKEDDDLSSSAEEDEEEEIIEESITNGEGEGRRTRLQKYRNLTEIDLPKEGIAPETQGQIYLGLSQLEAIKCKTTKPKKLPPAAAPPPKKKATGNVEGQIPPPPPPRRLPSGGSHSTQMSGPPFFPFPYSYPGPMPMSGFLPPPPSHLIPMMGGMPGMPFPFPFPPPGSSYSQPQQQQFLQSLHHHHNQHQTYSFPFPHPTQEQQYQHQQQDSQDSQTQYLHGQQEQNSQQQQLATKKKPEKPFQRQIHAVKTDLAGNEIVPTVVAASANALPQGKGDTTIPYQADWRGKNVGTDEPPSAQSTARSQSKVISSAPQMRDLVKEAAATFAPRTTKKKK